MFWIPMAIGAAMGALSNKQNPLKGAAIGAGMGAMGGAGMAAMGGGAAAAGGAAAGEAGAAGGGGLLGNLGAASTYGTSLGSQQTGMLAAQDAGMGGGLLDNAETAANALKPFGSAANSASNVYGLLGNHSPQQAPVQAPPMMQSGGGQNGLAALVGQTQQLDQQRMANDLQRRARQRQLISGIGGRNGAA